MIILIPKVVRKVWDKWNIRSFFIISILVQILLLLTATLRKKTSNKWVIRTIWAGYLLADWTANLAVNLIFDREEKYTDTVDDTGLLLVLWTPFLLLLLGGQDRITSLILTLLLLLAGTIKYGERTAALYLASLDSLGISLLREPDPGPNYEKLMRLYSNFRDSHIPVDIVFVEDIESHVEVKESHVEKNDANYAYTIANMYRGLIVNLMFSSREHRESQEFFHKGSSNDALRILEIELNFFYDILHTKVEVAYSRLAKMSRFISIGLIEVALSLFYKEEKRGFKRFDIEVTYTMFLGVLGLDMVTLLLWMVSDWTIASFKMKPIWKQSERETSQSELQERATPIIYKRWSETLSQFKFLNDGLLKSSERMNEAESRNVINKFICDKVNGILKYFHIKDFIDQMMNACTQSRRVFHQPLTNKLWEFIFKELLEKSLSADDEDEAHRISSARGGWVLENGDFTDEFDYSLLMPYVKEVAYDESLLFWHIATELCYQKDKDLPNSKDDKELSKLLSYYTLYFISATRFNDTLAKTHRFLHQNEIKSPEQACKKILEVDTGSVLFDACMLAKELDKLKTELKWKATSKVWVELLSYAASRRIANSHIQQLSKGGELLTFVWLLMAQLVLREAWAESRTRAKLIAG
ncbi:hypothetical protein ACB098_03G041200 [Castanea mollissima]